MKCSFKLFADVSGAGRAALAGSPRLLPAPFPTSQKNHPLRTSHYSRLVGCLAIVFLFSLPIRGFDGIIDDNDITGGGKTKDVNFKIFSTVFGIRAVTLVDEDLTAGTKKIYTVRKLFYTDISTQQSFITKTAQLDITTNDYGSVIADAQNPGEFTMPDFNGGIVPLVGDGIQVLVPDLVNDTTDLYVFTDMRKWISSGASAPQVGSVFDIVNGTSPLLPGVEVGLAPLTFDPNFGFVNSQPFTGDVSQFGITGFTAVPEASSLTFVGAGCLTFFASKISFRFLRRRKAPQPNS